MRQNFDIILTKKFFDKKYSAASHMLTPYMLTTPHMLTTFWPSEKATYLMAQGFQKFFMTKERTDISLLGPILKILTT